jgi:hypothetical protein
MTCLLVLSLDSEVTLPSSAGITMWVSFHVYSVAFSLFLMKQFVTVPDRIGGAAPYLAEHQPPFRQGQEDFSTLVFVFLKLSWQC